MECSGTLLFSFSSAAEAKKAEIALGKGGPETGRSCVRISTKGKELVAEVSAKDSIALRAVVNSLLRHIGMIENLSGVEDVRKRC